MSGAPCPLCVESGETMLWRSDRCRVILADEPGYPGFCRVVVWRDHVSEMTDLAPADRAHLMAVVFSVEAALREVLTPDKVNLASLGNQVPHLHWHIVPRFAGDSHFPGAVWSEARRPAPARSAPALDTLRRAVARRLDGDAAS